MCTASLNYTAATQCPLPSSGVYEDQVWLWNYSEATFGTPGATGIIDAITMSGAATGFKIVMHNKGGLFREEMAQTDDQSGEWNQRVAGRIVDLSPTARAFIQDKQGGRFVVGVRTRANRIKLIGVDGGAVLMENVGSTEEGQVGESFAFVCEKSPTKAYDYFDTDIATSVGELDATL